MYGKKILTLRSWRYGADIFPRKDLVIDQLISLSIKKPFILKLQIVPLNSRAMKHLRNSYF